MGRGCHLCNAARHLKRRQHYTFLIRFRHLGAGTFWRAKIEPVLDDYTAL